MRTDMVITLFHKTLDASSASYTYHEAYLKAVCTKRVSKSKEQKNGAVEEGEVILRIPTQKGISVSTGDRVCFGKKTVLPKDALTVTAVSDNTKGSFHSAHVKLVCV